MFLLGVLQSASAWLVGPTSTPLAEEPLGSDDAPEVPALRGGKSGSGPGPSDARAAPQGCWSLKLLPCVAAACPCGLARQGKHAAAVMLSMAACLSFYCRPPCLVSLEHLLYQAISVSRPNRQSSAAWTWRLAALSPPFCLHSQRRAPAYSS